MRSTLLAAALSLLVLPAAGQDEPSPTASDEIDRGLGAALESAGLKLSSRCTDEEFLRRATLDIVGRPPTLAEVRSFLAERSTDRRERAVDRLLSGEEYARYWAEVWTDVLFSVTSRTRGGTDAAFRKSLETRFAANTPWNALVKELLTTDAQWKSTQGGRTFSAEGDGIGLWMTQYDNGAMRIPRMTGDLTKHLLGIQIQCAECHDHPFDKWTQDDFRGMAGFFAGVTPYRQEVDEEGKPISRRDAKKRKDTDKNAPVFTVYGIRDADAGGRPIRAPRRMKDGMPAPFAEPAFLETGAGVPKGLTRRQAVAALIVDDNNPQFARAFVNRLWAHFFGRGIVHPYDDFTLRNRPSAPEVLDGLAARFVADGYDIKALIRAIALSKAYQQSSASRPAHPAASRLFAGAATRPLSPIQFFNAIVTAAADPSAAPDPRPAGRGGASKTDQARREFQRLFEPQDDTQVGGQDLGVPHALYLMNGVLIDAASRATGGSVLDRILRGDREPAARIESIYLALLGRRPSEAELASARDYVASVAGRKIEAPPLPPGGNGREAKRAMAARLSRAGDPSLQGYEDLAWTLMNSTEFQTNH